MVKNKYVNNPILNILLSNSYSMGPGIYGSKLTESEGVAEDKVQLRCHKSLATCAITVIYPIWLFHDAVRTPIPP